jgi:hypothetical protein
MRHKYLCLTIALFLPAALHAGQVYGSVVYGGTGVAQATIEITCRGSTTSGVTAADGSYRINVTQEGQCTFTLAGYAGGPSAIIFSNPNPSAYNFELVMHQNGTYELRRR